MRLPQLVAFGLIAALALATTSCNEKPAAEGTDTVARLCRHIVEKRQKLFVDAHQTETIWSDGAVLEVGTNFPAALQKLISRPTQYRDIHSFIDKLDAEKGSEWRDASIVHSPNKAGYSTVTSLDGKVSASVDSLYVEYIRERYPTARVRVKSQFGPVVFLVAGEVRASVMPVRSKL
jgi:hypothetical protein